MNDQHHAPAQGPGTALVRAQTSAVEARPEEVASGMALTAYAAGRDLERIVTEMTIPPDFQYVIPKWTKTGSRPNGDPIFTKEVGKVGISADGYDYLNRALGASFYFPRFVNDENGKEMLNPIHRKDYIYLRMGIVYYTPVGQLVSQMEDIEVDFRLMYQDKRANAKSAVPLLSDDGAMTWDEAGNPGIRLSPDDEMKCIRELTRARAFGPRYASTVGRVRLLKLATGLRSLPAEAAGRPFRVKIVAYRDRLAPEQRIAKATHTLADQYGGDVERPDLTPLADAEATGLTDIVGEQGEPPEMEQGHVAESSENAARPIKPVNAPWDEVDLADLDDV
jgi:hypothetical protein